MSGISEEQAQAFAAGLLMAKDLLLNETLDLSSPGHCVISICLILEHYVEHTKDREGFVVDRMERLIKEAQR